MSKEDEHPKGLKDCVRKDVYDRDHNELMKDIEEIRKAMDRKKDEMQKEINYKSSNNQKLIIWVGAVSLAVSGYLFMQVEAVRSTLVEHQQLLSHAGARELLTMANVHIHSLMCEVFGAMC